jgi:hypothetical protein
MVLLLFYFSHENLDSFLILSCVVLFFYISEFLTKIIKEIILKNEFILFLPSLSLIWLGLYPH